MRHPTELNMNKAATPENLDFLDLAEVTELTRVCEINTVKATRRERASQIYSNSPGITEIVVSSLKGRLAGRRFESVDIDSDLL